MGAQPSLFLDEMTKRAFGFTENLSNSLSGIYHVRDTELSQGRCQETFLKQTKLSPTTKKPFKLAQCIVKALDNTNHTFQIDVSSMFAKGARFAAVRLVNWFLIDRTVLLSTQKQKNSKGQILLDEVFNHLEILERDYFGLQYCATETRSQFNPKFLNSHLLLKNFNLNSSHSSNLSCQSQNEPQEVWVIRRRSS